MLTAMLSVLAGWGLMGLLFLGLGLGAARLLRAEVEWLDAVWLGLSAALLVLQAWNLFLPIDGRCVAFLAVASGAGWFVERARWRGLRALGPDARWALALGALVAVWLSNRALGAVTNLDSGVYHLPALRWAATYPVVPGIANLHPFLGVSHASFLYGALLDVGAFEGRSHHLANGFVTLLLVAVCLRSLARALLQRPITTRAVVELCLLPLAFELAVDRDLVGFSGDPLELTLAAALVLLIVAQLDPVEAPERSGTVPVGDSPLLAPNGWRVVGVVAAALFAVKVSSAGGVAGAFLLGFIGVLRGPRRWGRAAALAGIGAASLVPWSIASVLRTGYWPFPGAWVSFAVDWRVPESVQTGLVRYTMSYARNTVARWDQDLGWQWLAPWLRLLTLDVFRALVPLGLGLFALAFVAWPSAAHPRPRRTPWALLPLALALGFWFLTAPDVRYAGAWLWALAGVSCALALSRAKGRLHDRLMLALCAGMLLLVASRFVRFGERLTWNHGFVPLPKPSFQPRTTETGLQVNVPESFFCWDTPLPCTSHLDGELTLRRAGDLGAGFRLAIPPAARANHRPATLGLFPRPTQRQ